MKESFEEIENKTENFLSNGPPVKIIRPWKWKFHLPTEDY